MSQIFRDFSHRAYAIMRNKVKKKEKNSFYTFMPLYSTVLGGQKQS